MAHKNFESLKQAILNKAKEGMDKSVLPVVKDQMVKSIEEVVYDAYNPIEYHDRRRHANGGLGDRTQIKGRISDDRDDGFDFMIRNEAKAVTSNAELAPLIIMGQAWALTTGYELYHDRISSYDRMLLYNNIPFTPYYEPRDFISHTIGNLSKSQLAKKLESYMKS